MKHGIHLELSVIKCKIEKKKEEEEDVNEDLIIHLVGYVVEAMPISSRCIAAAIEM